MEVSLNGEVFAPTGKSQQRPMLLLKALLVAGDSGRTQQSVAAELWPDADDPKAALNVTVHRLRKMLGHDDSVVVTAGKIKLHEMKVWTDISALAELYERIDGLPDDVAADQITRLADDLLDLYQGSLCDGDEYGWLLPARERWRNRFLAAAVRLGRHLESAADWPTAQRVYGRALEAEPLAEAIYRGLMRCAHAQGDPSAAISAYRRCREMLSLILGRSPAPETEKLAASLGLK
jgi:DNA-binding SARP family transcriptional activator